MTVAPQKHAEIIEPAHNALELDAVDEKNRKRRFVFTYVVEKRILQVLRFFCRHYFCPLFLFNVFSA
jgi:hypothetical protein